MYQRFIEPRIRDALTDTRVVLLSGPRQSGKTTLGQKLADGGMVYMTLDNATVLAAARGDPIGFVRSLDRAIIDEVQRAGCGLGRGAFTPLFLVRERARIF